MQVKHGNLGVSWARNSQFAWLSSLVAAWILLTARSLQKWFKSGKLWGFEVKIGKWADPNSQQVSVRARWLVTLNHSKITKVSGGYGSIPINPIFSGMNIHLPAILMFTRRFWHTANTIIESQEKHKRKFGRMIIVLYVYLWIGENLLNGSCNSSSTIWIRAGHLWSRRTNNMSALKKITNSDPLRCPSTQA